MPSRRRQLILPALLVAGVAGTTFALFGGSAHAAPGDTTSTTATTAADATTTTAATGGATTTTAGAGGSTATTTPPSTTTGTQTTPTTSAPNGSLATPLTGSGSAPNGPTPPSNSENRALVQNGQRLFVQACSSCHGTQAQGTNRAPTIAGLGAATVDFWVSTGRMPLADTTIQAIRKPPAFSEKQSTEIAEYVASLAPGGPGIPTPDPASGNLPAGGQLFRLNCSTCHSFLAVGGALSDGAFAPSLYPDSPRQIAEAVRTGPGNMPRFSKQVISDQDLNNIIKYVTYIRSPDDRGGFNLAHIGPTAEGLIAFVLGVGTLMVAAYWIGDRAE